jgi:hypothetical protein
MEGWVEEPKRLDLTDWKNNSSILEVFRHSMIPAFRYFGA